VHVSDLYPLSQGIGIRGKAGFYGCTALTEVIIPEGMEGLGDEVFKKCGRLEAIHIPDSLQYMGSRVFENCPRLSIRCDLYHRPVNWDEDWNPDGRPVVWLD
jgi:hypothetical protein